MLSGKRRLEICAKGVRLGENSAERKARLFSAYVAAEAATHKALHCSTGSKKKNRSLAVLGMTGLERAIWKSDGGRNAADDVERTGEPANCDGEGLREAALSRNGGGG